MKETIDGIQTIKAFSIEDLRNEKRNKLFNELIKRCSLDDLCGKLPFGIDTMLDENGVNLSGGERQKIAIARALYKNPDILILDEATSNLDNVTEKKIVDMIKKITKDKTVITIAHRLSTIKDYDEIFVMKKGKIVDSGNYKKLCETNILFK